MDGLIKSYEKRLSVSESGMIVTNNSHTDLKQKIISSNNTLAQFVTRNNQLERKNERLTRESITQNSQLESIESQIKLVKENYAEPQIDSLANQLTLLNNKLVKHEDIERPMKTDLKNDQDELATLMADDTRIKSEKNTSQHEYSTLNQEKYTLEVGIRKSEKDKDQANVELIQLRTKEQDLIATSGTSVERQQEFDSKLEKLRDKIENFTRDIGNHERRSDSLDRDITDFNQRESKIKSLLQKFGYDETVEVFDVESIVNSLEKEQERMRGSLNSGSPLQYVGGITRLQDLIKITKIHFKRSETQLLGS